MTHCHPVTFYKYHLFLKNIKMEFHMQDSHNSRMTPNIFEMMKMNVALLEKKSVWMKNLHVQ